MLHPRSSRRPWEGYPPGQVLKIHEDPNWMWSLHDMFRSLWRVPLSTFGFFIWSIYSILAFLLSEVLQYLSPWERSSLNEIQNIISTVGTRPNNPTWMQSYKCIYARRKLQLQAKGCLYYCFIWSICNSYTNSKHVKINQTNSFFSKIKFFMNMHKWGIIKISKTHGTKRVSYEELDILS